MHGFRDEGTVGPLAKLATRNSPISRPDECRRPPAGQAPSGICLTGMPFGPYPWTTRSAASGGISKNVWFIPSGPRNCRFQTSIKRLLFVILNGKPEQSDAEIGIQGLAAGRIGCMPLGEPPHERLFVPFTIGRRLAGCPRQA